MLIRVTSVLVPADSTIGFGRGVPANDDTKVVYFVGDHRMMAGLAEAGAAAEAMGAGLLVEVPDWAVLEIEELP